MTESYEAILLRQTQRPLEIEAEFLSHMKIVFKTGLDEKLLEFRRRTGISINRYVPIIPGSSGDDTSMTAEEQIDALNRQALPDVYVGFQYKEKMCPSFRNKFFDREIFETIPRNGLNSDFLACGLDSRTPELHIFSCCPFVIVADKKNLEGLAVPQSWEDLMRPEYRGKICFNGTKYGPDINILLYFDRLFGRKGLEELRRNTACSMHASRMNRYMGTGRNEGLGIYLMSLFFANAGNSKPSTEIVWPKEGAAFQPIFVLGKTGSRQRCKVAYDYILGSELGQILADNCFPSTNPEVDNHLEGQSLDWFGWDFIYQAGIDDEVAYIERLFGDLPGSEKARR